MFEVFRLKRRDDDVGLIEPLAQVNQPAPLRAERRELGREPVAALPARRAGDEAGICHGSSLSACGLLLCRSCLNFGHEALQIAGDQCGPGGIHAALFQNGFHVVADRVLLECGHSRGIERAVEILR